MDRPTFRVCPTDVVNHLVSVRQNRPCNQLYNEIDAITKTEERAKFIREILRNFHSLHPSPYNSAKDADCAKNYFTGARKEIEENRLELALVKVIKGMSHVEPRIQEDLWLQGLLIRSDILFRLRHPACARDLQLAISLTSNPAELSNLKDKFDLCVKYKSNSTNTLEDRDELFLRNPHPLIPSASDALRLEVDPVSKARHLVAAREIKPGEILICEDPLISYLDSSRLYRCCCCMKVSYNLIPCDTCRWVMYCSEQCKEKAKAVHSKECLFMPKLICAGIQKEKGFSLFTFFQVMLSLGPSQLNRDEELGISKPLLSTDVNSLLLLSQSNKPLHGMELILCTLWAKMMGLEEEFDQMLIASGQLHSAIEEVTFSICELKVPKATGEAEVCFREIGTGVYPVAAMTKMSCLPNTVAFHKGHRMLLQATRLIRPGTSITRCDIHEDDFLRNNSRNRDCEDGKCEACENDWPTMFELPNCNLQDLEVDLLCSVPLTPELLPLAFRKAEEMELRGQLATKQFHMLQDRIRMALAKQGNMPGLIPTEDDIRLFSNK